MPHYRSFFGSLLVLAASTLAQAQNSVTIDPGSIDFGTVESGDESSAAFQVKNNSEIALQITAQSSGSPFSVTPGSASVAAGQTATLTARVSGSSTGTATGKITLTIKPTVPKPLNLPPGILSSLLAPREVALHAILQKVGLPSAPLDFGTVAAGQSKSLAFQIQNPLTQALQCQLQMISGSEFTVPSNSISVPPGGQSPVTVNFTPPPGLNCVPSKSGSIRVSCGNPNKVDGTIGLRGSISTPPRALLRLNNNILQSASVHAVDAAEQCVNAGVVAHCSAAGEGGGAFGGTVSIAGGCQEGQVQTGHQVTVNVIGPLDKFEQFTQGTGSAAACNGRTTPSCSFTMTQESSLFVKFRTP